MMPKLSTCCTVVIVMGAVAPQATAQTAVTAAAAPAPGLRPASASESKPWIKQLLPVSGLVELGATTGLMFPSNLINLQTEYPEHQSLAPAPELGIRGTYFPIKYMGGELEYVVGFSKTNTDNNGATLWALRAQLIGQYPAWRITPFALLGAGRIGVWSSSLGNDGDPAIHFGVGAKAALTRSMLIRLDLRDNISQKFAASNGTQTHSFEVLVGASFVFGRPAEAKPVAAPVALDADHDGLLDSVDKCPTEAAASTDGCPVKDKDGDGVADGEDKCPEVKGNPPDGCPLVKDSDGDGVPDDEDKCVETKGDQPDGCMADQDTDNDGIVDSQDKCPNEVEIRNGFEDTDGCPDELPAQVKEITGILSAIEFEHDKATLSAPSMTPLGKIAQVLAEYPSLRVLITGHTNNLGNRENNVRLSKARAETIKAYLVSTGMDGARIGTMGTGPDEPLSSNLTAAGRKSNQRIEIQLLKD